jgi:protein SCO1/2
MNPFRPDCEDDDVTRRLPLVARLGLTAAALALAATGCGGGSSTPSAESSPAALHGAVPTSHPPRPSFTLVDTDGKPYDFGARTRNRVTMLYFGYTHCPDECPTSMADVAAALRRVPPEIAEQVTVVFVTTDPWRDSKPVLRKWLDRFSPTFVGLTGSPTQIAGAEVRMGMPISRRVPEKKSKGAGRYSVDHFAAVMAYGRDNRVATLYPSGVTPGEIAADLPVLVKG